MLTTTNPMIAADQARQIAERRTWLACQRHTIEHALLTDGTAAEDAHVRRAAEALMVDVVMAPDDTALQRLLCELYRMAVAGEPDVSLGAAFREFVRGNVRLAAEINWQAREDGEGGLVFIPGVRHG